MNLRGRPRVGVLTFHRPVNYGSYWQARCLLESLAAKGFDAEIVDHDSAATRLRERRLSLRPTLPTPNGVGDRAAYARKIRRFERAIAALPRSESVCLDRLRDLPPYDALVLGSDEIWNPRHPIYRGHLAFFGSELPAKRRMSYAASFGNYSSWEGIGEPQVSLLSRLDGISVRDENSWWMLRHALGREYPLVLDPTLLDEGGSTAAAWNPYVLVYGHNFSSAFADEVSSWARDRGARTLSFGYRNGWADESILDAPPEAFDRVAAGAAAIATNFFHGCAFALRHRKPFAAERSEYREIKVRGLLDAVGALERLVSPDAGDLATCLAEPPSPRTEALLSELRVASHAYLDETLA